MHRKKILAAALSGLALALGTVAVAPSALAAPTSSTYAPPPAPLHSQGCAGDVCMYLDDPSGGTDTAHAWLYSTTYFGRFKFTGPGFVKYSPYQTWYGGGANGTNYYPATFPAVVGQYCFTFYWTSQTAPYTVLGTEGEACENIE